MRTRTADMHGFTLIEIVIVILMIGIIATIATQQLGETVDTAHVEQTKNELDNLGMAIVGNPDVFARGARSDFGYVGDIGALPPNLDALVQNPGSWATWDGPYIERGLNPNDFRNDAWNTPYAYANTLIQSVGSGSDIDKLFAPSTASLLSNRVSGWVVDADREIPPSSYNDSVTVRIRYPDGSGGLANIATALTASGGFTFNGIPIGNHQLRVIYGPDNDTAAYDIAVYPGRDVKLDIVFPADLW